MQPQQSKQEKRPGARFAYIHNGTRGPVVTTRYPMPRRDLTQPEIVQALRAAGASVAILAGVGGGVPDLLVGWRGSNYLVEVKNPAGRGDRLTPAEAAFHALWAGQLVIVRSVGEALALLGVEHGA